MTGLVAHRLTFHESDTRAADVAAATPPQHLFDPRTCYAGVSRDNPIAMRHEEALVALIFERVHVGAVMEHNSSQAHGEWDFNLRLRDGLDEPVEVTLSTDSERHRIFQAILGKEGSVIQRRRSNHDWFVVPHPNANILKIRKSVDLYLSAVESTGVERFSDGLRTNSELVQRLCSDLKIAHGTRCTWNPPGQIRVGLPGRGGLLSGERVVTDVEVEANKPDNRIKLGRSVAPLRHLVVVMDYHNGLGRQSMLEGFLPARLPSLPSEITDAWVVARLLGDSEHYLVWHVRADQPWRSLETLVITDSDISARAG
jgi:hypothetical protein